MGRSCNRSVFSLFHSDPDTSVCLKDEELPLSSPSDLVLWHLPSIQRSEVIPNAVRSTAPLTVPLQSAGLPNTVKVHTKLIYDKYHITSDTYCRNA